MTSKKSFFKLMKNDLFSRLYLPALAFLAMFLNLVVGMMMMLDNVQDRYNWMIQKGNSTAVYAELMTKGAQKLLLPGIGITETIIIIGAVISAAGFCKGNSRKKVDFYNSLPIKRRDWFLAQYANGILVPALIYLVCLCVSVLIAAARGAEAGELIGSALFGFFVHMSFYLLNYSMAICGFLLSGNTLIGLGMIACLDFVFPILAGFITGFKSMFFRTYYSDLFLRKVVFWSPVTDYARYASNLRSENAGGCMLVLGFGILFGFVAFWIFIKRPSEASQKAVIVPWLAHVFRIVLSVLAGMGGVLLFYNMRRSGAWGVFGGLFCTALLHVLLQIILYSDIRKACSAKVSLVGCCLLSGLLFASFYFDWYGYDTWIPEAGKVQSAGFRCSMADLKQIRGSMSLKDGKAVWNWDSGDETSFMDMKLENPELAIRLAEKGVAALSDNSEERKVGFEIAFQDPNGNTRIRSYMASYQDIREELGALLKDSGYKEAEYPILTEDENDYTNVIYTLPYLMDQNGLPWYEAYLDTDYDKNLLQKKVADRTPELVLAYKKDLETLDLNLLSKENPVAELVFLKEGMPKVEGGLRELSLALEQQQKNNGGNMSAESIIETCAYPVYPSYKNTIEVLKSMGINCGSEFESFQVKSAGVLFVLSREEGTVREISITDPAELEQIKRSMKISADNPFSEIDDSITVSLYVTGEQGEELMINGHFPKEKVPEFLKSEKTLY